MKASWKNRIICFLRETCHITAQVALPLSTWPVEIRDKVTKIYALFKMLALILGEEQLTLPISIQWCFFLADVPL